MMSEEMVASGMGARPRPKLAHTRLPALFMRCSLFARRGNRGPSQRYNIRGSSVAVAFACDEASSCRAAALIIYR